MWYPLVRCIQSLLCLVSHLPLVTLGYSIQTQIVTGDLDIPEIRFSTIGESPEVQQIQPCTSILER